MSTRHRQTGNRPGSRGGPTRGGPPKKERKKLGPCLAQLYFQTLKFSRLGQLFARGMLMRCQFLRPCQDHVWTILGPFQCSFISSRMFQDSVNLVQKKLKLQTCPCLFHQLVLPEQNQLYLNYFSLGGSPSETSGLVLLFPSFYD